MLLFFVLEAQHARNYRQHDHSIVRPRKVEVMLTSAEPFIHVSTRVVKIFFIHQKDLKLEKSSVSNSEADRKGDNTSHKTSTVSNDSCFVNLLSMGSKRCNSGSKSCDGGGLALVLGLLDGLGELASRKGLERRLLLGDRGKGRGAGNKESHEDQLVGLHVII